MLAERAVGRFTWLLYNVAMTSPPPLASLLLLLACCQVAAVPATPPGAVASAALPVDAPVADTGSHLDVVAGFVETRRIPSPHATQAAAADARYALCDLQHHRRHPRPRRPGELVATATADWYASTSTAASSTRAALLRPTPTTPAVPHESDIRVFDPATGRLSVYHQFPDPPGSLVWCLRRAGNWWCCFAWYGEDNARSVLVEYADGGLAMERRRFRFPVEVVADFDGMSASGGIWDGDTMLVSHHHFPVLYRLGCPRPHWPSRAARGLSSCSKRSPARFPGRESRPIRCTGGLVGIDRTTREIVLARPLRQPPGRSGTVNHATSIQQPSGKQKDRGSFPQPDEQ